MSCDRETGEVCREPETGELVHYPTINVETGEQETFFNYHNYYNIKFSNYDKRPFRVREKKVIKPGTKLHSPQQCPEKPFKHSEKRVEFFAAIMFLIPSVIVFNVYLATLVIWAETMLHIWCHKKNRELKDPTRCYRSPLHVISKEFCARCKAEASNEKIHKIQEIRLDKLKRYGLESIRRVVT